MGIKRSIIEGAARAAASGAQGSSAPTHAERRRTRDEQQASELATAQRERDEARVELAKANVRAAVTGLVLAGGVTEPVEVVRIANLVETVRARCAKTGEAFDWRFSTLQVQHERKKHKGETSIPPVPPNGTRPGAPVQLDDVRKSREAYRKRLRELGLLDPAFGSFPGDTGGPGR